MRVIPLLLSALLLAACSGLDVINAVTPDRDYESAENIAYATGQGRRLDIYSPRGLDERAPVVVFFHGGRWSQGSKSEYKFVGEALTTRGIVAVVADYRKHPEVRMPGFMDDAAQAVRWTRDNVSQYGGDPRRIFVMGHSSGGHMAALLALDDRYLRDAGVREPLSGFIGLAGAYDFLPIRDADLAEIFGPEDRYDLSQPIKFARPGAPPALLIHAKDDETVWIDNAENLAQALREAGAPVSTVFYERIRCAPGVGSHACTITALSRPFRGSVDVLDHIADFVDEQGGTSTTTPSAPAPMERSKPRSLDEPAELKE